MKKCLSQIGERMNMSKLIAIHSFRGGTGKSNTTANCAAMMAKSGFKVGIVDTDIQSPGIYVPLGLKRNDIKVSLNHYLWEQRNIEECALDLSERLQIEKPGKLYFIPSSADLEDITKIIHDGYDVNLLNEGFQELLKRLKLDALLIDTHPGLNDETLLSIALSDVLVIILRPDHQDYQGTDITVAVAKHLDVPRIELIMNKTPLHFHSNSIKEKIQKIYDCPVLSVIYHSDELMTLASETVFSLSYPSHPLSLQYKEIAYALLNG